MGFYIDQVAFFMKTIFFITFTTNKKNVKDMKVLKLSTQKLKNS